jgi:diaminopimelate decarboxylase
MRVSLFLILISAFQVLAGSSYSQTARLSLSVKNSSVQDVLEHFPVEPVHPHDGPRLGCVLAGPTCDSIDVVAEDLPMPELAIGELLVARQIGAYTIATATDFNFFPRARVVPVNVAPSDG